ncbi:MAG: integrin alpha [Bacteroidia bacterium]
MQINFFDPVNIIRFSLHFWLMIFSLSLSCQTNGEVKQLTKLNGDFSNSTSYGSAISWLPNSFIVIGSPNGQSYGEVFLHQLNSSGMKTTTFRIARNTGGFGNFNIFQENFGASLVNAGDLNDDGINEIVVGAPNSSAASSRGAIWFLSLNGNHEVIGFNKLSDSSIIFQDELEVEDRFGSAIANIGDLDGNGYNDFAVGAPYQQGGCSFPGDLDRGSGGL